MGELKYTSTEYIYVLGLNLFKLNKQFILKCSILITKYEVVKYL
jgi:hypothetical protein